MARALRRWGLNKGDRLAILSENRPEWTITDFASLLLGVVVVPIYSTLTAPQTAYILTDSGTRVVVVSTQHQLDKVLSIKEQTAVERIVVMDSVNNAHAEPMQRLMQEGRSERDPTRGGVGEPFLEFRRRLEQFHRELMQGLLLLPDCQGSLP